MAKGLAITAEQSLTVTEWVIQIDLKMQQQHRNNE